MQLPGFIGAFGGGSSLLQPPLQVAVYLTRMCWMELECWSVQRSQVVNRCFSSCWPGCVHQLQNTTRGLWAAVRKSGRLEVSGELKCSPVAACAWNSRAPFGLPPPPPEPQTVPALPGHACMAAGWKAASHSLSGQSVLGTRRTWTSPRWFQQRIAPLSSPACSLGCLCTCGHLLSLPCRSARGEESVSTTSSLFDFWYSTPGHRTDLTTWLENLCCHHSGRVVRPCSCTLKSSSQIAFESKTHSWLFVSQISPHMSHLSHCPTYQSQGNLNFKIKFCFFFFFSLPLSLTRSPLLLFQREFPKADGPPYTRFYV